MAMKTLEPLPDYLQERELSEDLRNLIVSLPTEKGWVANHLHQYQGFWHTTRQLKGVIACQNHFHARESDIFLITPPKSGTTWLKALTFALLNRRRFPNPKQNHPLLTNNPHVLIPFFDMKYIDTDSPDFSSFNTSPRLFSTHLPLTSLPKSVVDLGCKIVYLCRNPKDNFVSLWQFTNKLRSKEKGENSFEDVFDKFCRGVSLYGPFWDHILGYWKKSLENPETDLFLKYEDFKKEPKMHLKKLSEFLECPFSKEESNGVIDEILNLCSFDTLSNLEVNKTGKLPTGEENCTFFRRGEVGDSRNYLTNELLEKLDLITKQKWHAYGFELY